MKNDELPKFGTENKADLRMINITHRHSYGKAKLNKLKVDLMEDSRTVITRG